MSSFNLNCDFVIKFVINIKNTHRLSLIHYNFFTTIKYFFANTLKIVNIKNITIFIFFYILATIFLR